MGEASSRKRTLKFLVDAILQCNVTTTAANVGRVWIHEAIFLDESLFDELHAPLQRAAHLPYSSNPIVALLLREMPPETRNLLHQGRSIPSLHQFQLALHARQDFFHTGEACRSHLCADLEPLLSNVEQSESFQCCCAVVGTLPVAAIQLDTCLTCHHCIERPIQGHASGSGETPASGSFCIIAQGCVELSSTDVLFYSNEQLLPQKCLIPLAADCLHFLQGRQLFRRLHRLSRHRCRCLLDDGVI
mmetsp:Transcript_10446/g.19210  ORF Transcript_10446/g.19210 Transcript_10446/m.19210 type:complete len:246 (-) Transcript_10446:382-1119(-)